MEFAITFTPGLLVVLVSWVAAAVGSMATKEDGIFFAPFVITVGWGISHIG